MSCLDAASSEQTWWMGAVTDAINMKTMVEQWLQDIEDQEVQKLHQNLDQEFLVTKTIGNAEVWADFQAWMPSSQQEYDQLVKKKCNVRQITKDQLQKMASEMKLPIEILPGKIVHTRKSGSGAYGSRAVICGNDAGPDNNEHYAGGVDGQQVRTMVRLGALKQWQIGCADIRTAFLNAPRRDNKRLIAMEIPSACRKLQLAGHQEIWLVDKALYGYGLTTSPHDWGLHRDEVMPTISWHRQREGREVFGAALMKTPMKTFGGLRRWARSRGGPLDWFDVGLLCRLFFLQRNVEPWMPRQQLSRKFGQSLNWRKRGRARLSSIAILRFKRLP